MLEVRSRFAGPQELAVYGRLRLPFDRRQKSRQRAALEPSSMGRNILNHAALASRDGRRDLAGQW